MKKVVLSLAVLFSMAMVSCGGNKEAQVADSDSVVAEEEVVVAEDSNAAGDTVVAAEVAEVAPADSAAA